MSKKVTKFQIDLEKIVEDEIYRKLVGMHYEKIEEFKQEVEHCMSRDAERFAKIVAIDILEKFKEIKKK